MPDEDNHQILDGKRPCLLKEPHLCQWRNEGGDGRLLRLRRRPFVFAIAKLCRALCLPVRDRNIEDLRMRS